MTGATGSAKPGGVGATGATGATATGSTNPAAFTGQINPTSTIHNPPPSVPSINRLTAGQIGAFGTIVVDLILAQVAFALGGVNILGVKPFSFLTDWGNALVKQAEDAYKNSFVIVDVVNKNPVGTTTNGTLNAVYSAAAAVNTSAVNGETNAGIANGNISTTWNALWDGAKGNTGSPSANKTIADVKSAVVEVRNTGITADGKAQDTIDGVYSAVMGGEYTGLPANYVKPALTGLTYTARNNVATGTNLVIDPSGDYAGYWNGQAGVAQNTNSTYSRTGTTSVSLTSAGSTARTLFFNTIDTGVVQAYFVRQSEIYYVECWLKSATAMGTVQLVAKVNGSTVNSFASVSMSAGTWIKLSGQYTIPAGVNTASFGIQLDAGATTNGSVVYVDDMLVREITNAQTAQTNVESTWNQIYNGVYNLNLTGRNLTDVFNALYTTKQTADGGVSAAGTAQGAAEGAAGKAKEAYEAATGASAAAAGAARSVNNLYTSTIAGYQVTTITSSASPYVWTKPTGLSELYVACFGGGGKGVNGVAGQNTGGKGGSGGGFVAQQIDVNAVPATVTCTVGAASSTNTPTATTFGSLLSSEGSFRGYVASPLGVLATGSQPGSGGDGGGSQGTAGQSSAGGAVPGGAGGAGNYSAPGNGGTGVNFGLSYTGGGGGGGGSGVTSATPFFSGGNGGFPGGGGGGGFAQGGFSTSGGAGANGLMIIIYKTANK